MADRIILVIFLMMVVFQATAQDDLLAELEAGLGEESLPVEAIFKGTRLIHGHSVKVRKAREMELLIQHRFGTLNEGAYYLFGLDNAHMRIGLDYGLTDRLNLGAGRSSVDKTYDGFVKFRLLQQEEQGFPFTVTGLTSMYIKTSPSTDIDPSVTFADRLAYSTSILIARKFSSNLSIQLMPVWIHKNTVEVPDINDLFTLGSGLRYKITPSVSVNFEYYYRLNAPDDPVTFNSVALGVDIETGGHVFQLHLSNSRGMMERSFISETRGDLAEGDIHFGFNISRTFQFRGTR